MADFGLRTKVQRRATDQRAQRWVLGLLLASLTLAEPVSASPVKPGAAIAHFDQGSKAFADGRFADALKEFQTSMTLEPSPNTRIKIARCYKALGQIGSAYVQFHRTAHEAQDRINATGEARYAPTRDAAEAEAQALDASVPRLSLELPSPLPADLRLILDGTEVPRESFARPIPIDPGDHILRISAPRFADEEKRFSVAIAGSARLSVSLSRIPAAELQLVFANKPAGMVVFIDGKPLAPEQFDKSQWLSPGSHSVEVRAPGYAPFQWQRALSDAQTQQVPVSLRAEAGPLRWVALSLGGAAVASLAIGVGFGVMAQQGASEQTALDPLLRERSVQSTIQNQATLATTMLTVGGVLGGAATVLGIVSVVRRNPPSSQRTESVQRVSLQFIPQLCGQGGGLSLLGRY